jgi:Leucine-rich repeat (LRR) protein
MEQATQPKQVFWKDWDREQTFLPAIRSTGLTFNLWKRPDATYRLTIQNQALSDLSFLKDAPISELIISGCKVVDLSPLQNLPLQELWASENPVSDLTPLRGLPLERLRLTRTNVSDLSPLIGLPLKELYVSACANLTDVALLAEIPTLEKLTVPAHARNIEALRKLPKLQMLAFEGASKSPWFPTSTARDFGRCGLASPG